MRTNYQIKGKLEDTSGCLIVMKTLVTGQQIGMHSSSRQFSDYNRIRGKIVEHRMIESTDRMMRPANRQLSTQFCGLRVCHSPNAKYQQNLDRVAWMLLNYSSCEQGSKSWLILLSTELQCDSTCSCTAVSSEAWAKLRDWASVAGRGRLLLSGSVAHASLKTAVETWDPIKLT